MTTRARPPDCCVPVAPVKPLDAAERATQVAVFRALGEPTRLEIFRLIAAQSAPICVCDIVDRFPLQQPTISHHLKVLREAGLVTVSRCGVWSYYALSPQGLAVLRQAVAALTPASRAAAS